MIGQHLSAATVKKSEHKIQKYVKNIIELENKIWAHFLDPYLISG